MAEQHAPDSSTQPRSSSSAAFATMRNPWWNQFRPGVDTIINAVHEAIITIDEQHCIVMVNPAAQRMFGYTSPEILGRNLSRLVPAQHRRAHAQHVREFAQTGTTERTMSERAAVSGLRANGEQFPAAITICQLDVASEFGPRRFLTALVRDLSESNALQAELDDFNRRMRALFELSPVAIWITDRDRINFANRACAGLFATATSAELLGRSIYDLLRPESHASMRESMARALAGEQPVPAVRERIVQPDGTVRNVELAVAALPDHGRTALQMVLTDITRQSAERRELELSRAQLRQLSAGMVSSREEERRRIARELHDELGQRLTALKMEISSLPAATVDAGRGERVTAMLQMVDETINSVRRIATDLRPLMLDDLGLNAALEWLADGWARRMGIAVRLRLCSDEPPLDQSTAIALYRMVQEALTNVARHAHATEARVSVWREDGDMVLTVRDNGVGFAEPAMYNAGSHGLMGIRERAYMLGGTLEIGNASAGGGHICVRLPLERASAVDAPAPARATPAAPAAAREA